MPYEIATIGELGDASPCCDACASSNMGGLLPTIVWPSDVEAYKRKVDPDMRATEAVARSCASLSAATRSAWSDFYAAWRSFFAEDVGIFGSSNKWEEAHAYERTLAEWQDKIGASCALQSPHVIPPAPDDAPDLSVVKYAAVAVALVAVAYLASPLVMGARKVAR